MKIIIIHVFIKSQTIKYTNYKCELNSVLYTTTLAFLLVANTNVEETARAV